MAWELQYGPTYEWASLAEKLPEWSERLRPVTDEQSQGFAAYKQYLNTHPDSQRRG